MAVCNWLSELFRQNIRLVFPLWPTLANRKLQGVFFITIYDCTFIANVVAIRVIPQSFFCILTQSTLKCAVIFVLSPFCSGFNGDKRGLMIMLYSFIKFTAVENDQSS